MLGESIRLRTAGVWLSLLSCGPPLLGPALAASSTSGGPPVAWRPGHTGLPLCAHIRLLPAAETTLSNAAESEHCGWTGYCGGVTPGSIESAASPKWLKVLPEMAITMLVGDSVCGGANECWGERAFARAGGDLAWSGPLSTGCSVFCLLLGWLNSEEQLGGGLYDLLTKSFT